MKVLLLTPDLFGAHGGIARHSRVAVKALSESPAIEQVDVMALMDRPRTAPDPRYFDPHVGSYVGFGGNRRQFASSVARVALRARYDLVLTEHVNLAPLMFFVNLRAPRAARATVMHGIDVWSPLSPLRRLALRRSHLIISVSRFTADAASRANRLDPRSIAVVHNCLDPYFPIDVHGLSEARNGSLLTVSRLLRAESSKGHDTILRALPRVAAAVPDVRYDVVGDGDLRPDLEQLAASLRLNGRVRFHGSISDDAVSRLYRSCAAYVMPSKWEGFGLVFLEAMAYGRPIVASTRDAAAEVLGDAAVLVEPDDPASLAEAIRVLLQSGDLRTRLGRAAHARLNEQFTFERFKNELLMHAESAVGRRAA